MNCTELLLKSTVPYQRVFPPNSRRGGVHLLTDVMVAVSYFMTNIDLCWCIKQK